MVIIKDSARAEEGPKVPIQFLDRWKFKRARLAKLKVCARSDHDQRALAETTRPGAQTEVTKLKAWTSPAGSDWLGWPG